MLKMDKSQKKKVQRKKDFNKKNHQKAKNIEQ